MRDALVLALLLVASSLTLVCSVGVAVMRDPLQRLHFIAPPAALSAPLLAAAVFVDGSATAGLKAALVTVLVLLANGVATHATARAVRVRRQGRWEAAPDEHVAVVHDGPGGGHR